VVNLMKNIWLEGNDFQKNNYEKIEPLPDTSCYFRIVTALSKTIEIQKRINAIYPEA